jgi:hypothetical protein
MAFARKPADQAVVGCDIDVGAVRASNIGATSLSLTIVLEHRGLMYRAHGLHTKLDAS